MYLLLYVTFYISLPYYITKCVILVAHYFHFGSSTSLYISKQLAA